VFVPPIITERIKMKLHLGCGKRYIPGFIHMDVQKFDHIDYQTEVDNLDMVEDNSCSLVYTCHVLEHFKPEKIPAVLREWYRVIRPGGICRISVPDFAAICRVYMVNQELSEVIGPIFGRQDYLYNIHRTIFDYETLGKYLIEAGFKTVRPWNWRKTEHKDIDDFSQAYIPHMEKEKGTLISLNMEGIK
jgi:predicted SAM-dependent methyltransferase